MSNARHVGTDLPQALPDSEADESLRVNPCRGLRRLQEDIGQSPVSI